MVNVLEIERKKKHLSASELAKICNINKSYISLIESGKKTPSIKIIIKLADTLGICQFLLIQYFYNDLNFKAYCPNCADTCSKYFPIL